MADTELCFLNGGELAALIRQRAVSPVEMVEALLTRIDQFNDGVRAYLCVSGDQALAAARGAEIEIAASDAEPIAASIGPVKAILAEARQRLQADVEPPVRPAPA